MKRSEFYARLFNEIADEIYLKNTKIPVRELVKYYNNDRSKWYTGASFGSVTNCVDCAERMAQMKIDEEMKVRNCDETQKIER